MPTVQVTPKLLLSHHGVDIYHTYKTDDYDVNEPSSYHYSTAPNESGSFDVRDLPREQDHETHETIIRRAIDNEAFHLLPVQETPWTLPNADNLVLELVNLADELTTPEAMNAFRSDLICKIENAMQNKTSALQQNC